MSRIETTADLENIQNNYHGLHLIFMSVLSAAPSECGIAINEIYSDMKYIQEHKVFTIAPISSCGAGLRGECKVLLPQMKETPKEALTEIFFHCLLLDCTFRNFQMPGM